MLRQLQTALLGALQGLWFVPGAIIVAFGVLAAGMVEIDKRAGIEGTAVFDGDGSAARTVLSVIAGSLITVAGLTFSITMVVLQLTSSQFSPRILRTFFGDRLTQVTVGAFVGIFTYSIIVLRSVGGGGDSVFVPRLSVTVASGFAILAVVLLVVFIHHVSQLIQVSHVTGEIAHQTLARLDTLYPSPYGRAAEDVDAAALIAAWEAERPGLVLPPRPGYVQRIELDDLIASLGEHAERAVVLARPGDFVSIEEPLVAVWPAEQAMLSAPGVLSACRIASERDLAQDVDFGLRQLTDTAVKAMSPGINDPTTACTCVGYIRAILVRLAGRDFPELVRDDPERGLRVVVRRREFDEYIDSLAEIGRYSDTDARVVRALLEALVGVSRTARQAGGDARVETAVTVAGEIGAAALEHASSERDRESIRELLGAVRKDSRPA